MRVALIEGNVVTTILEADSLDIWPGKVLVASDAAEPGMLYTGGVFSAPVIVIPLAEAKSAKIAQIERDRDAACAANVTAHGRQWQADARSQSLLGQAITLASAGLPLPAVWRDADNGDMQVATLADLLAIAGAIAQQVQSAYAASWARKAAVEAAADVAQVGAA